MLLVMKSFAILPVTDVNDEIREKTALGMYAAKIPGFLNSIAKTKDTMSQLSNLNGLINTQQQVNNLCNKVCSQVDRDKLQHYLSNLNQNIIGQFKNYSNVLDNNISTLSDLSKFILNAPVNTKEVGIALQRAAQESLEQVQNTLLQIQALLVLDSQKRQAEEKIERENTNAIYKGFAKAGL